MATKDRQARIDAALQNEVKDSERSDEHEIDIISLLLHLLNKYKIILGSAILGALLAALYTYTLVTPLYTASSKIYVLNSSDSALNLSDLQIGSYLANDYLEVFNIWEVHEEVIRNLDLNYSYGQMESMLAVSNPSDTRIIKITITSPSAHEAMLIANEYASVAKTYISSRMSTDEPNILSVALEPGEPSSPNKTKNLILGFLIGALVSGGIITLTFVLDDRIHRTEDIEDCLGVPTLGVVPINDRESENERKRKKTRRKESKDK